MCELTNFASVHPHASVIAQINLLVPAQQLHRVRLGAWVFENHVFKGFPIDVALFEDGKISHTASTDDLMLL